MCGFSDETRVLSKGVSVSERVGEKLMLLEMDIVLFLFFLLVVLLSPPPPLFVNQNLERELADNEPVLGLRGGGVCMPPKRIGVCTLFSFPSLSTELVLTRRLFGRLLRRVKEIEWRIPIERFTRFASMSCLRLLTKLKKAGKILLVVTLAVDRPLSSYKLTENRETHSQYLKCAGDRSCMLG